MHRTLFAHTIRKSRRAQSLIQLFHRGGQYISCGAEANRYFTTLEPLRNGSTQLKWPNQICCRCHNTGNRNDAVNKPIIEEAKKPKKTRKRKSQKTKVTEVTSNSAKQTNITIQIIRAKELSKFIGGGSVATVPSAANENNEEIEKPILVVPNKFRSSLRNIGVEILKSYDEFLQLPKPAEEVVHPLKMTEEDRKSQETEGDRKSQEESLIVNWKAYISACVHAGLHRRSLAVLQNLFNKKITRRDIELYTIVLHDYASRANWQRVKEVCDMIKRDGMAFTPQVYAAICECIGRLPHSVQTHNELREYLKKAESQGITMNDILNKSKFITDQRERVLNALYRIDCRFKPVYDVPTLTYTNPMLESLNQNVAPVGEKKNNPTIESPPYKISNAKRGFSRQQLHQFAAAQMKNEMAGKVLVKNITVTDASITDEVRESRQVLDTLFKKWEKDVLSAFKQKVSAAQHKMAYNRSNLVSIYPYLKLLPPEQFVDIMMEELEVRGESSEMYTLTTRQLYQHLGEKVYSRVKMEQRRKHGIADKVDRLYTEFSESLCSGNSNDNPRQLWQRIVYRERGNGPDIDVPEVVWPWQVICDIGKLLLEILLNNTFIDANLMRKHKTAATIVPALYTTYRNRDMKVREELRSHPTFAKLFRAARKEHLMFATNLVPMLCPPIPWSSHKHGGYFCTQADLLRLPLPFSVQIDRIEQLPSPCNLYPSLDAINQLGCIPWRVNTRLLDIIIDIFNQGGSDKFHVPKPPQKTRLIPDTTQFLNEFDSNTLNSRNFKDESELYSLGCDTTYKLSLTNHFRDKIFWLPHNMDFRGRVYPVPPHLTHLSSDLNRSLLHFHQKQPLGENGLKWLKLHCINLTGLKKRDSVQDRLVFAESVLDDIIDSADNPIDGRQWWLKSDEPWQTLGACMEIADAIRSGDPATYMSGCPIHQDGSCNGLQHYAALGRDKEGAISVNLGPCERPQDVYSTVAYLVEKARVDDARNGNAVAIALEGLVQRKVVKQTVMTTVYGVTRYGARLQIEKQLKNLPDFPPSLIKLAGHYLTEKVFNSLGAMFTSATEIQDWFTDCARYISKTKNQHVEWVTPLGLPVVQPYMKKLGRGRPLSVVNMKQGLVSDRFGKLNNVKEKNAFPPNFIHSLDSCHMMLTSLHCERAGLTFVSVHDCFWTHASTVPAMNRICREQFVALHSRPILDDLSAFFQEQYEKESTTANGGQPHAAKKNILCRVPERGEFDLKDVLDSVYFFS